MCSEEAEKMLRLICHTFARQAKGLTPWQLIAEIMFLTVESVVEMIESIGLNCFRPALSKADSREVVSMECYLLALQIEKDEGANVHWSKDH